MNIKFPEQRKGCPLAIKPTATIKTDVIIVGGGAAGCTLAALLASNGVDVVCLDGENPASTITQGFDGRTMAISYGSRNVLAVSGIWQGAEQQANPIKDIQILEQGSASLLDFVSSDVKQEAFGWVIEYRHLRKALYDRLAALPRVKHMAPSRVSGFDVTPDKACALLENGGRIEGKLIVGADGKNSFTREWAGIATRGKDYNQTAIVCITRHEHPHNNIAVEDFRAEGPFAILPMQDDENGKHRSSIVWTEHGAKRESAMSWDEDIFTAGLQERFPDSYGAVKMAGPRFSYPLGLKHAHSYTAPRMALIGDAAHAIHPIAGQGLNLGLRDVAALAELVIEANKQHGDLGGDDLLNAYSTARRADNMIMAGATNTLNALFSNDLPLMSHARKVGLKLIQRFPKAKGFFMRQAMGMSGLLPKLVKTGKL